MSATIGRNDPCPCGSGRKYKKCCLERQQEEDRREAGARRARERRNEAVEHALGWLGRHHREALFAALEEFESAAPDDGRALSAGDKKYFRMQALEWALAEGVTEIGGREVRLRDLVLQGGLVLEADQRLWLERATAEPLRLWKVVGVRPGEGLELEDLLDDRAETVWTTERSGSRRLRRTEVVGARLARWNDGWEAAVLYSIPDHEVLRLVSHLEDEIGAGGLDPQRARRAGKLIRDFWVRLFTRRPPIPDILDSGGDPIELTTDHWQVVDEDELTRRLAAEPDVVGTRDRGWARVEDPEAVATRSLLALNPGKRPDRLEVFARTRKLADEGRTWLESVAGRSLRFLTREIVDPMSERVIGGAGPTGGRSLAVEGLRIDDETPPDPDGEIPPDLKSRLIEKMYRQHYTGIADRTIPAFGDKTARQVLREPGGERRVRLWLEGFERTELRMAENDGREPVDLGFLWEEIGLAR